jgi:hypothetical protein
VRRLHSLLDPLFVPRHLGNVRPESGDVKRVRVRVPARACVNAGVVWMVLRGDSRRSGQPSDV